MDEVVATIESDKGDNPMRTPEAGVIKEFLVAEGDTVEVGQDIFVIDTDGKNTGGGEKSALKETEQKKETEEKKADDKPAKTESKPAQKSQPKKTEAPKQDK